MEPSLGIVILNYNDAEETLRLLSQIEGYSAIDKIVVIDNASTDNSKKIFDGIQHRTWDLVCAKQNRGYACGNNLGIRYLLKHYHVDIVGVSNPDVEFDNDFIVKIKKDFRKYNEYAIIAGLQYGRDGQVFNHAFWKEHDVRGSFYDILKKYPIVGRVIQKKYRINEYVTEEISKHNELFSVDVVGGCLFFTRADVLRQIGYFDEGTFLFFEEDILAKKIKKIKMKIGVDPQAKFVHKGSISIDKALPQVKKTKMLLQSQRYFFTHYISDKKWDVFWLDVFAKMYLLILPPTLWAMRKWNS